MKSTGIAFSLVLLSFITVNSTAFGQETITDSTKASIAETVKDALITYFEKPDLQFFRPNDSRGINVFETTKLDTVPFRKLKVRVGGNFTMDYQFLKHKNDATPVIVNAINTNELIKLKSGFNLPMANLRIDAQLMDGIRMNLTLYLSSRHHSETWVKGGYIQIDKLLFLKSKLIDVAMKSLTIKMGVYDVDYGDQHYRRTDGGSSIYNPFVENYIMDEFTTELGGEVYYHHKSGLFAMAGITNGELNPTVVAPTKIDSATGEVNHYTPAFHGKLGFDKQITTNLRMRLTGSFYMHKSAGNNTMFFGDRTGSHYFLAMENTTATAAANAWSGRLNPRFNQQVRTFMINPFVKYRGLEFFGTFELAQGRTITEKSLRTITQYAADLIYRFPRKENFWLGARYNTVKAELVGNMSDVNIDRIAGTAGWLINKNIMLKVEYVYQKYRNYAATSINSGGEFKGVMIEAGVAF